MKIKVGDKINFTDSYGIRSTNVGTVLENSDERLSYRFQSGDSWTITKIEQKPLYKNGQIVVTKNTNVPFIIESHYHNGIGFTYVGPTALGFRTFYKEEDLRPQTEQEKQ